MSLRSVRTGTHRAVALAATVSLAAASLVGVFGVARAGAAGPPDHLKFITQPGGGTGGIAWVNQPVVAIEDSSGNPTTSTALVSLAITAGTPMSGGPGTLTCAPVNAVVGVATFSGCKIDTVGTAYKLTATDPTDGLEPVDSTAFNITPGSAAQLGFTTQPGNGAPGGDLSVQPVVTEEDAGGNPLTTGTAMVTLAIGNNAGGGTLSCTTNPVTAINGVATFSGCQITNAGIGYTLTATSTAPVLTMATSLPFNVGNPLPTRIMGVDAIGTSIATSLAEFPSPGSAGAVVLARSDFFSDALAGGPLAAAKNAPLLITPGAPASSMDSRVQAEILRVLPAGKTVYILGGPAAISLSIDTTLEGLGYTVVRVPGVNEYATAVLIANLLGNPSTIFEATGLFFADALSAVPAAIHTGGAILLTNGATQAPETLAYIAAHIGDTRYAIGGPLAAFGADPSAIGVFGPDLFGTSAAVATRFLPHAAIYGAATGLDFPDALGGGVYMATGGRLGPVLLVNTHAPLPLPISAYLFTLAVGTPGIVFGGPVAVGNDVLPALQAAVG